MCVFVYAVCIMTYVLLTVCVCGDTCVWRLAWRVCGVCVVGGCVVGVW